MGRRRSRAGGDPPAPSRAKSALAATPPLTATPGVWLDAAKIWGAAIFVTALTLRAIYLWEMRHSDAFSVLVGDAEVYDAWARGIVAGDWLGHDVFYQAPLYPYFLAVLYWLCGATPFAARSVQIVLGSLSCWLVFEAGRRFFSLRIGIVAGFLLAIYPTCIFFDGLIQKSALDLLLTSLLLVSLATLLEAPSRRRWLVAGIVLGCLVLTRENVIVVIPVLITWQWLSFRNTPSRERVVWTACLLFGAALIVLPVGVRNAVVGGEFHLTTAQFGPNFYIGNGPQATGRYAELRPGGGRASRERADATELAEAAMKQRLTPSGVSDYWTAQALAWIRTHPADWLRLMLTKWLLVWNASEVTDTEDQMTFAEDSLLLRATGALLHFGVLVPLAAAGVWMTRRQRRRLWILYATALTFAVSVAAFYVVARYRYPLVPVLVLFAAAAVCESCTAVHRRDWRTLVIAGLIAAAVAIVANLPLVDAGPQRAPTHFNIGGALAARGDLDGAQRQFVAALRFDPKLSPAWNNLGNVYAVRGKLGEAEPCFREALRLQPALPEAHSSLAVLLNQQGKTAEAIEHLQEAVRLLPRSAELRRNLGLLFLEAQQWRDAAQQLGETVRLEPSDGRTRYDLARALANQGDTRGALVELEAARRLAQEAHDEQLIVDVTRRRTELQ